jgi:hypothetical protein
MMMTYDGKDMMTRIIRMMIQHTKSKDSAIPKIDRLAKASVDLTTTTYNKNK